MSIEQIRVVFGIIWILVMIFGVWSICRTKAPSYRWLKCSKCLRHTAILSHRYAQYCGECGGNLHSIETCKVCGEQPAHIDGECLDCCH